MLLFWSASCLDVFPLCPCATVPLCLGPALLRSHNGHHSAASGVNDMLATLRRSQQWLSHNLNMSQEERKQAKNVLSSELALSSLSLSTLSSSSLSPVLLLRPIVWHLILLRRPCDVIIESWRGVEFVVSDNLITCFASNTSPGRQVALLPASFVPANGGSWQMEMGAAPTPTSHCSGHSGPDFSASCAAAAAAAALLSCRSTEITVRFLASP